MQKLDLLLELDRKQSQLFSVNFQMNWLPVNAGAAELNLSWKKNFRNKNHFRKPYMYLLHPDFILFSCSCEHWRYVQQGRKQELGASSVCLSWAGQGSLRNCANKSCEQETSWRGESHQNPIRSCCWIVAAVMLSDVRVLMFRENWEFFAFFSFPPPQLCTCLIKVVLPSHKPFVKWVWENLICLQVGVL